MPKIAIYVEGQTEQILIRDLLFQLMEPVKFGFECLKILAKQEEERPYSYNLEAKTFFRIVDVGNDELVLKSIKRNEEKLVKQGFSKIIGLRDMYSNAYRKRATSVDKGLIEKFITGANETIAQMNHPDKISFHFSIMETEAWLLGMYNLFAKIEPELNYKFIETQLGYNLAKINPQTYFFHPANEIKKIFQLIGLKYDKSEDIINKISSKIEDTDILEATENNRCNSFKTFYEALTC